jgi:hypothetical protein
MGQIVPFYAADQGIVDTLCDIIRTQHENQSETDKDGAWNNLTPKQQEILGRILKS